MTEEKNCDKSQTKVELQIIPCAKKATEKTSAVEVMNHESQDDPCIGKIILTVSTNASKITKIESERFNEFQQDLFVTTRITEATSGKIPNVDVSIQGKFIAKGGKA